MTTKTRTTNGTHPFIQEDPPRWPPTGWAARLHPLTTSPGIWYRIYTGTPADAYRTAHNVRHAKGVTDFDIVTRKLTATTCGVWARYTGPVA